MFQQLATHINQAHFTKYHTVYKREFGSQDAALLLERLEYWSRKYPEGFWKFFEPCLHHRYKQGDSWEEELALSRKVFNRAFTKIGMHYKSKSDFDEQEDPFQGKLYASYYNRKTNLTYYFRNHDAVAIFLRRIWQSTKAVIQSATRSKTGDNKRADQSLLASKNGRSRNSPLGTSLTRAPSSTLQRTTSSIAPELPIDQRITPEVSRPSVNAEQDEREKNMALEMIQIWNTTTLNQHVLRPHYIPRLINTLSQRFENNLELWKGYCLKIASSKFLMGEAPNTKFKAFLGWIIKPEIIHRIMTGLYSLGDRAADTPQAPHTAQINQITHDIEHLDRALDRLKDDTRQRYRRHQQEQWHALSSDQQQHLRTLFEAYQVQHPDEAFAYFFRKHRWNAPGVEVMFDLFVDQHLNACQHHKMTEEDAIEQTVVQSGLREQRTQLWHQRATLQQAQHAGQTLFVTFSQSFRDFVLTDSAAIA